MQLGMIGLGRMGANMVRRVIRKGHQCVVFDMSPKAVEDVGERESRGIDVARRFGRETRAAACGLVDGASGGGGRHHR